MLQPPVFHDESPNKIEIDENEPMYFNSPKDEKVYTPRRVISALSNASIISPVDIQKTNSARRAKKCIEILDKVKRKMLETEDDSRFNTADYKELLDALRLKVLSLYVLFPFYKI